MIAAAALLAQQPDPSWQYGYSATPSLSPEDFRAYGYFDPAKPISFWHPARTDPSKTEGNGPGYYPYVAINSDRQTQIGSRGWALRPDEIAMEGSNTGQYSLVRYTVPAHGRYEVHARFEGIHFRLSSTDVHVLLHGKSLFDADIAGYGGDPAFHPIEGPTPSAEYAATITLKTGDTITFAVGYGKNKTHFNDTTGLIVSIRPKP